MDNKARFMENMITVRYKPCDDFFKYAGGNKTKTDIEDTEKALILQMFNDDSLFKKKEGRAALLNELLGSILFDEGYVFNNCAVYMSDNFPIALNKLAIDTLKKDRENYKKFKKQFFTYADLIMHEANVTISTSTEILDEHKEDLIANLEKNKFAFFEQSLYKDDIFDEVNGKLELTHPRHSRLYNNLRVLLKYDAEKEHHTHRLIPSMTQNQASHANLVQTNFFHWGPFLYPMYDPSFPHILGFSSIGFVMAHEMAHTYAFASRVYPEFEENRQCLLSFYSNQCSEDKKVCIDPELTYVENVADQLGFIWAYSAYKRMESVQDVGKRPRGKKLNKLSNDKMFFLNYAQIMHFYQNWEDYDDKKPHSPSSVRAWGPLANLPAFTNEFKCPKESKYNPKKKCPMFVAQTMVNDPKGSKEGKSSKDGEGGADGEEEKQEVVVVEVEKPSPPIISTDSERRRFIMKTSGLILAMLVIATCLLMLPFIFQSLRLFLIKHWYIALIVSIFYLCFTITVACFCHSCLMRSPVNYFILVAYAFITGLFLMCICATYSIFAILVAMVATVACVLATLIFAATCNKDLTSMWFACFIIGIVLLVTCFGAGIICIFVPPTVAFWISIIISMAFVLYYMFHMTITIQSIIGGKNRKIVFSEQAYAVAALLIFVDIIGLFLNLLNLANLIR
ncbi:unnamed protein product [Bursaphelenchus okinawaensis]|uniref:Peptidase M13 C-terminal domain-containing protein n=1 Tax=Bursaphelenchus okinawaensis TaxID=465554 RepID=A0A811LGY8_9BILA|nr:unnamed protein product [Bursaphelenchus okinawaensis]CAG9122207.1 unnamed protein product [Bursaphelenchus okinawaensis]